MMIDGVEDIAVAGINTALDTVLLLTAAGQPVAAAVESSRILTVQSVREHLQKNLGNKNASVITHTLANPSTEAPSTAPSQSPTPNPLPQTAD
ncbi:hypothetical protein [Pseudomonas sp. MWU12-2323]|uniref:hypothetical protein n=1 Tax=Pseudomonas sp. MWU12-2323 TaxID=2651296 RepID=UPI00128B2F0C|nr:hypothetical protein [Pseudomonas sp. MWU12-2323]MPQ69382.1 hypothetical protein [Pseudomonas sp. MWU12-2323]